MKPNDLVDLLEKTLPYVTLVYGCTFQNHNENKAIADEIKQAIEVLKKSAIVKVPDSTGIIGRVKARHQELHNYEFNWNGFYNGWLEGRVDMLNGNTYQSDEFIYKRNQILNSNNDGKTI